MYTLAYTRCDICVIHYAHSQKLRLYARQSFGNHRFGKKLKPTEHLARVFNLDIHTNDYILNFNFQAEMANLFQKRVSLILTPSRSSKVSKNIQIRSLPCPPRSSFASSSQVVPKSNASGGLKAIGLLGLLGLVGVAFGVPGELSRREKRKVTNEENQVESKEVLVSQTEENTSTEESAESPSSQQSAFNPETGEINWDCPCLGGMAHGVCGEQFKSAFSCFVYSEAEPKGVECIDKFKLMQECFKEHPDVYGEDLIGQEEDQQQNEDQEPVEEDDFTRPLTPPTSDDSKNSTTSVTSSSEPGSDTSDTPSPATVDQSLEANESIKT
ncbi:uncharacterized protein MELLADRAFT_65729 [Melampsora larici-populina 98AG31]|uniref:Mitochondrial intermembrane space import and assembly protein 40 n=1 Tax=Melampsora larici-populina (strain 98AG31 / pathotype 3-4-7) TaxID=747676 RepID=F4RWH6_MELLP|nr:uncharacterized protein MELLADRAFT_65729 [Melampsora larici-populina 98AG31]EGG03320.1 hypothetical protein MELLADRAFT_65729 [Melampsora larici-populina 98AG31]